MTEQAPTNLILRGDTILGVCEALGQDFGISPTWFRVAFCLPVFWNPAVVIGAYFAIGLLVVASRYAFPDRYADVPKAAPAPAPVVEVSATRFEEERELIAA